MTELRNRYMVMGNIQKFLKCAINVNYVVFSAALPALWMQVNTHRTKLSW